MAGHSLWRMPLGGGTFPHTLTGASPQDDQPPQTPSLVDAPRLIPGMSRYSLPEAHDAPPLTSRSRQDQRHAWVSPAPRSLTLAPHARAARRHAYQTEPCCSLQGFCPVRKPCATAGRGPLRQTRRDPSSEKQQFPKRPRRAASIVAGFDRQVVVEELRRPGVVRHDAPDPRGQARRPQEGSGSAAPSRATHIPPPRCRRLLQSRRLLHPAPSRLTKGRTPRATSADESCAIGRLEGQDTPVRGRGHRV